MLALSKGDEMLPPGCHLSLRVNTFQGIATFNRNGTIAGRAKTTFNFATFGLNKPTIARLMSVDDKITFELVYRLERS